MSHSGPSTPEHPARTMPLNRSFTVPTKIATTSQNHPNIEVGASEGVETLFVHHGKVVKFTTTGGSRPGSSAGTGRGSGAGTLPWTSPTEQTIAAGPVEIYRVPGSVSFLHSGSLLQAILPRSNCWCVDGVSKFAMRVLPDTYYRIELPSETPDDLAKVEEFKATLRSVLFYERTTCPFDRAFSVDLPDEPSSVRKKRRKSHGPAKKWKLDRANSWKPEDGGEPPQSDSEDLSESASDEDSTAAQDSAAESRKKLEISKIMSRTNTKTPQGPSVKDRIRGLTAASRSFTAPPQLSAHHSSPSRLRRVVVVEGSQQSAKVQNVEDRVEPKVDEALEQRTLQAIPTDMPPSPPDSSIGFEVPELTAVDEETEGENSVLIHDSITVLPDEPVRPPSQVVELDTINLSKADTSMVERLSATSIHDRDVEHWSAEDIVYHIGAGIDRSSPATSTNLVQSDVQASSSTKTEDDHSDPFAQIQARIQARRSIGGTTSFHPSLQIPTRQSSRSTVSTTTGSTSSTRSAISRRSPPQSQQAFATALVKKACSAFLGPPAHLVIIMLRIAARFANGTFGDVFSWESPARDGPRKVPGSFDLDASDVEDLSDAEDWEEDDFGVPIRSPVRRAALGDALFRTGSDAGEDSSARQRSGWDVD